LKIISGRFPFCSQEGAADCGPACLCMILQYYRQSYSLSYLRQFTSLSDRGVSVFNLSKAAKSLGLECESIWATFEELKSAVPLPCVMHWKKNHFVVIYKITFRGIYVADPGVGLTKYSIKEFLERWRDEDKDIQPKKVLLVIRPANEPYTKKTDRKSKATVTRTYLSFLFSYKKKLIQILIILFFSSAFQLLLPFLTQALVDKGIGRRSIRFVYLVLLAQMVLFVSRTAVDFARSRILLHIGSKLGISIASDFLKKIMKLPQAFFDCRKLSDILQHINDNRRIESFLGAYSLEILYSLVTILVFCIVLIKYSIYVFVIFIIGSLAYASWALIFLKRRKALDNRRFAESSNVNEKIIQLIQGIHEIKLNCCEREKRRDWERVQTELIQTNINALSVNQFQQGGANFINELANIVIIFYTATGVIRGIMTMGMMLAIQYILGQLNSPINRIVGFIDFAQDAKLSLKRTEEIYSQKEEDYATESRTQFIPGSCELIIENLSFKYEVKGSNYVLRNVSMIIPNKKMSAIVGVSGSGKSTLLKIMLKLYNPNEGSIRLGETGFDNIDTRLWRRTCAAVMQDGYIFTDSIAKNIALGIDNVDMERLKEACRIANIRSFIESLPSGYDTIIGPHERALSQGQKQRILIARAIYKNAEYIFLDEATNALDTHNEAIIMENLEGLLKERTVVVIAHRLSTVRRADRIFVLDKGEIIEVGTHIELSAKKGAYFSLVKEQLELGN